MDRTLPIGPITPLTQGPLIFALDSDESSMLQPEAQLLATAKKKDEEYVPSNSLYACSVLMASHPDDIFILDQAFESQEPLLNWLRKMYAPFGIHMSEHIYFAPPKQFPPLAKQLAQENPSMRAISTICYSYNLAATFPDEAHLVASRYINSKTALPAMAKKYGLSVPKTIATEVGKVAELCQTEFDLSKYAIYIKLDGLGGGANVMRARTLQDLDALNEYPANLACIVQQAVPEDCVETIHLYTITNQAAHYEGSRTKMVVDNQWYGNIFTPDLQLTPQQREAVDTAADAARREGYADNEPLLLGIDAFMNSQDMLLIEYNARWLGSSPTEYILRRLGNYETARVVAMSDTILESDIDLFMKWVEAHLLQPTATPAFSVLPLGFSGYVQNGSREIGCIVFGDFHAFKDAVRQTFHEDSFPLLEHTDAIFSDVQRKLTPLKKEK